MLNKIIKRPNSPQLQPLGKPTQQKDSTRAIQTESLGKT